MSILQEPAQAVASADDTAAIADLKAAFDVQRRAFAADRRPSLDVRRERVGRIAPMMIANRERISAALAQDFGSHPKGAADLIETLAVAGRVQYVLENLEAWTAPQARPMDAGLFGTAHAYVEMQPKGVVGNMIPWNFPFDIGVGPMVEMLAAGNRVILKPSEYVPACAALLREMVAEHFSPDLVYVAVGGVDLARAFAELPFDHLLYTGSPGVGRQVMAAAARNLTPVTLELGGKCPAVVLPGATDAETVKTIVGTKIVKNGQMCVSVDYTLVPRGDDGPLRRFGPGLHGRGRARLRRRARLHGHHHRAPPRPAGRAASGGARPSEPHRDARPRRAGRPRHPPHADAPGAGP